MSYGNINSEGIPFFLMDPARSPDGKSLVVLKGGGRNDVAKTYPQRVEVPADVEATRFYLLSGIAGWGYPATRDPRPAMKVTATPNTKLLTTPLPTSLNTSTPPCIWLQKAPESTPISNTPTT